MDTLQRQQTRRFRETWIEATLFLAAALVIGLLYTAVTGKGLFSDEKPPEVVTGVVPPEYVDYTEVRAWFDTGEALLVDARSPYDFELGHIRGAISLPLKEFESRNNETGSWDKDALIVTYCDGEECNSSMELAHKLAEAGFTNVKFFFGGWQEWVANDAPREGEEQ